MTGGRGLSRATLLLFALMGVAGSEEGPRPGGPIPEPEPEPELLRARLAPRPIPIVPRPYLEGGPPAPPDETRCDEKKRMPRPKSQRQRRRTRRRTGKGKR